MNDFKITIQIETENNAFADSGGTRGEFFRVANEARYYAALMMTEMRAERRETAGPLYQRARDAILRDINGNACGLVRVEWNDVEYPEAA